MTETLPDVMDDETINNAVEFINERVAAHVYNGSIEIGNFVLEKFFNNNITLAGSRNPFKPVSYNKLCKHPDLSVSRSTLTNMVKTAAQCQFLYENGIPEDGMKYTQKVHLTRLENNEDKLELVRAFMDERFGTEELKLRIREICQQSENVSVSPGLAMNKYLTRVERWIRGAITPEGMTNPDVITSLSPSEKEKILDAAGGILEDMSVISNRIRQLVEILIETPAASEIESPISTPA